MTLQTETPNQTPVSLATIVESIAIQTQDNEGHLGPSLLQQLREARHSSIGRGSSGGAAGGLVLNVKAHELWEDLTGRLAAMYDAATDGRRANKAPEVNLLAWHTLISADLARGAVTDVQIAVQVENLQGIADRIRTLFNPPPEVLLTGHECPFCRYSRVRLGEGELEVETDTLAITWAAGELLGECRHCGQRWEGRTEVIQLARLAGFEIDTDAIREALAPDTPKAEQPNDAENAVT